jgi:uncharacterized protein (DUF4213/DUF364 family)
MTLKPDEMKYYVPYQLAHEKIPHADFLIITGTTIINDSLESLLGMMKPGARATVVGPTASMLPTAFFRRGVTVLGGVTVTDADKVLDVISEAGSGIISLEKEQRGLLFNPFIKNRRKQKMLNYEDAVKTILDNVKMLGTAKKPLLDWGR